MNNFWLFGFLLIIFGLGPNRLIVVSGQVSINRTIIEECYNAEAYAELVPTDSLFYFQWYVLNGSSTAYELGNVYLNGTGHFVILPGQNNSFSEYYRIENYPKILDPPDATFSSRLIFDLQNSSVQQFQFRISWFVNTYDTELKNRSVCEMNCINSPCYCGSQTQKLCSNSLRPRLENGTCGLDNQGSITCREVPKNISLELLSIDEIGQPIRVLCHYTEGYPDSNTFIYIDFERNNSSLEPKNFTINQGEIVTLPLNLTKDYVNAFMYCQARNSLTDEYGVNVTSNEIVFNVTIPPSFKDSNSTFVVFQENKYPLVLEIICNPEPSSLELEGTNGTNVTDRFEIKYFFNNHLYQLNVTIDPKTQWFKNDTGTYVLLLSYNSTPNTISLNFDIIVSEKSTNGKTLSSGEIAGIVIGCVAGVALIGFIVYFFAFKSKKGKEDY